MTQWAVVYFPDGSLTVEGVGPFRSRDKALAVAERLSLALDPEWADESDEWANRVPQVVALSAESEAVERDGVPVSERGTNPPS